MTIADVKSGGWATNEVLTSAQMNLIRAELLKAMDGAGGGSYSPSAHLVLGGANELRIDSALRVRTGGDLVLDVGATFDVNCSGWTFDAAGAFNAQVDVAGAIDFFADVDFRVGSTATISELDSWTVADHLCLLRVPLVPIGSSFNVGATRPYWEILGGGGGRIVNNVASGSAIIFFAVPVMAGDVIEDVILTVEGGAGAGHAGVDPTNKMRLRIFEGNATDFTRTSLLSVTDPQTGAAYDAPHSLALTGGGWTPYTALDRQYTVEVRSENGGTAADGENVINGLYAQVTRKRVFSTNTMGS